jgi:hypothetical protein
MVSLRSIYGQIYGLAGFGLFKSCILSYNLHYVKWHTGRNLDLSYYFLKPPPMTLKGYGILAIIASIIISVTMATSVNMDSYELGAVFNLFIPPFIGLISIILFLVISWITKDPSKRIISIVLCVLSIYP